MSDTDLQSSEASVILSDASAIQSQTNVILSEAKDLSSSEAPTEDQYHPEQSEGSDLDAPELDLALEDELIIEDFTIDGICGVY